MAGQSVVPLLIVYVSAFATHFWWGLGGARRKNQRSGTVIERNKGGRSYSKVSEDGVEVLSGDLVIFHLTLKQRAPRFIVVILADVAHMVYGLNPKDGKGVR